MIQGALPRLPHEAIKSARLAAALRAMCCSPTDGCCEARRFRRWPATEVGSTPNLGYKGHVQQLPPPPPPAVYYSPDGRYWWNGSQWVPVASPWVMRKSATPYVIASLFLPGLGSLLLGRIRNGLVLMGAMVACWITWMTAFLTLIPSLPAPIRCSSQTCAGVYYTQISFPHGLLVVMAILGPIGMAAWVLGIVDALHGTQAWNRAHGLPE
jgi:hypothetical protein